MDRNAKFNVEFLEEAVDFIESLDKKTQAKIYFNIRKAQFTNSKELFKKLTNYIWEFRTIYNRRTYRLFAFWDKSTNKETLVIATHGIEKKSEKTPRKEIEKAEKIRKIYFDL